eukprot:11674354-Alexandrium_andersonii.AAC.1
MRKAQRRIRCSELEPCGPRNGLKLCPRSPRGAHSAWHRAQNPEEMNMGGSGEEKKRRLQKGAAPPG